jgi:hypothetical protein
VLAAGRRRPVLVPVTTDPQGHSGLHNMTAAFTHDHDHDHHREEETP